jgi:hypothetical protein
MTQKHELEQHEEDQEQEHEIHEQHEEKAPVDSGAAGESASETTTTSKKMKGQVTDYVADRCHECWRGQ